MSRSLSLLFVLCCLTLPAAWADELADYARLSQHAHALQLAQAPYWHKLLHYRAATLAGPVRSDIVSPEFFLSPAGMQDPEAELEATLRAMLAPPGADPDAHAQCRFVARYQWLRERLDRQGIALQEVRCPRYEAWFAHGGITSLSVIFATGYFSNPASYYGHLLLRFDSAQRPTEGGLLDQTLNFGAIVPEGEPGLLYVAKGIFGGYQAAFSSVQFYRHNHSYAEDELRDMWAYQLDLTPDEVRRIAAHGWELLHVRFDYYFAKENCAYRMAQLLNLVVDEPLLYQDLPWSAPGTVFDRLMAVQRDGRPLVRQVSLIPSRLHRFHARYRQLDAMQRLALQAWVAQPDTFGMPAYAALDADGRTAVVDALLEYAEFRRVRDASDPFAAPARHALLLERMRLPPRTSAHFPLFDDGSAPPHVGPRPNLVRFSVLDNRTLGQGVALELRPAYFDRLSLDAGRIAHATLSMFDAELVRFGPTLRLRRLDVVDMEHMNLSETPLPGDGGMAWRLRFGLDSHDLACLDCLVGQVTGGLGRAVSLAPGSVAYVMADVFTQTPYAGAGNLGVAFNAGMIVTPAQVWKSSLEIGQRRYLGGACGHLPTVRWQNRFGDSRDFDVRLNYEKRNAAQWQLAASWYW
ncbi:MAG: DUF4105 domain-containing protein [Pseudomonadota bacterium]